MANIPVFLASDDNYAPFVATTIASICDNTKSFVDFYILDSGINEKSKANIKSLEKTFNNFSVEYIIINPEQEFKNFGVESYLSLAAYNRLLIPQLKPNLDKALYLDVDIIVMQDIKELFEQDLAGLALGAAIDQGNPEYIAMLKNNLEMNEKAAYFNSGVLLMDLKKWRNDKVVEKLFKIEEKYRGNLMCNDQDILNKYFENNYKILDKKFNVMVENDEIVIRHYVSAIKPWHVQNKKHYSFINNLDDFMHYANILKLDLTAYKMPLATLRIKELIKKKELEMEINNA